MSADEDDEELLYPWSSLALVHGLEALTESTAIASPLGPSPRRLDEGKLLHFWLERRPDVAARALLSTLFTDRCFTNRANQNDGVVRRVGEMTQHALDVQRRWSSEVSHTTMQTPVAVVDELPQSEVTFAAQFIHAFVTAGGTPDVSAAVQSILSAAAGGCGVAMSHEGDVDCMLSEHIRSSQALAHRAELRYDSTAKIERPPPTVQISGQRRTLSLRVSAEADKYVHSAAGTLMPAPWRDYDDGDDDGFHTRPQRIRRIGRGCGLHTATLWLGNVTVQERQERLHEVQQTTNSIRVRSRDEIAQRAEESAARQSSTTLVRSDRVPIAAPQWTTIVGEANVPHATAESESTSAADVTSPTKSAVIAPSTLNEVDRIETTQDYATSLSTVTQVGAPEPHQDGVATAARNVTWVDAGELALVNGRVVVLPARSPRGGGGRGSLLLNVRSNKAGGMAHRRRGPPPRTATAAGEVASGAHTYLGPTVTRRGKRSRPVRQDAVSHGRSGGGGAAERECVTAVSTQHVELKTRDELRVMVGQWDISATLREALLIGLEISPSDGGAPGAGERGRGGVLRLQSVAGDAPQPVSPRLPSPAQDDQSRKIYLVTPTTPSASLASATWVASSSDEEEAREH